MLVLGSGAGGLWAAGTGPRLGRPVIAVDKAATCGGATAWSGGRMWVPRNPLSGSRYPSGGINIGPATFGHVAGRHTARAG